MKDKIERRHRQLLVHSFLYYRLGQSIIPDTTFDAWRREMAEWHREYPDEAKKSRYYLNCQEFETSPSGFFIKEYPPELVSLALQALFFHQGSEGDYEEFLADHGFRLARK